jgi:hypothetical protein
MATLANAAMPGRRWQLDGAAASGEIGIDFAGCVEKLGAGPE